MHIAITYPSSPTFLHSNIEAEIRAKLDKVNIGLLRISVFNVGDSLTLNLVVAPGDSLSGKTSGEIQVIAQEAAAPTPKKKDKTNV